MYRKTLTLFTFLIASSCASAQTAHLWPETDPIWKTRSVQYWNKNAGYSKQAREKMVAQIGSDNAQLSNDLGLRLQKVLLNGSFAKVQRTQYPAEIELTSNDLLINLSIGLKQVSDYYPFFKKSSGKNEPHVTLKLGIYAFDGSVLLDSSMTVTLDYSTDVKPLLHSTLPSEKPIEEYRISIQAGIDKVVPTVGATINRVHRSWMKNSASRASNQAARESFKLELDLILSKKRSNAPEHYNSLVPQESTAAPIGDATQASRSTEGEERLPYNDKAIANELTEGMQGVRYFGLFIGMQDYVDPAINDLDNPVNDATRLRNLLINQYTFTPETTILLKNPGRTELLKALDYLTEKLTEKDNLLIFYAGHGLYDEQLKSGFWLMKDATQGSRSNWISNGSLRDYIGGIKARHTLLVADACFSGGIFKTREAFQSMTKADHELYKLTSRKAMTSGAMKTVPDKSVFIEYLLKRLGENQKTFLTSEALFASFKSAVINNSPNGQVPQFGEIRETGDEGGDFIFVKKIK